MPLIRVDLRRGKPAEYRRSLLDGIYQALRETFDVPEADRFMVVTEHETPDFDCDPAYLGIVRSDDLVIIQLTVSNTRNVTQKKALYRRIVELLVERPGVRPEDVFINLVEVVPANWSFGYGVAQYVPDESPG